MTSDNICYKLVQSKSIYCEKKTKQTNENKKNPTKTKHLPHLIVDTFVAVTIFLTAYNSIFAPRVSP
jgi:hypothetical protein